MPTIDNEVAAADDDKMISTILVFSPRFHFYSNKFLIISIEQSNRKYEKY